MGRNVVRNLKRGKVTPPPHASPVVLTDGTAVCNCPRGGNEAMQIEAENLWSRCCPTRFGVLRIEDVNGRTRPAEVCAHRPE